MNESPFARLPDGLRNAIYDFAMDHNGGFEMRADGRTYDLVGRDTHFSTPITNALALTQGLRGLGETTTIECQLDERKLASNEELGQRWSAIDRYAQPVFRLMRTQSVVLRFRVRYHRFGSESYRYATSDPHTRLICNKDAPMSCVECGTIDFDFSNTSTAEAKRKAVKSAFEAKRALLDAHADRETHKTCVMRMERPNLLRGLAEKETWVMQIVESLPEGTFELTHGKEVKLTGEDAGSIEPANEADEGDLNVVGTLVGSG